MFLAVALSMKGIPAVYFHSLCGNSNDLKGYKQTKRNRTVNRKKWNQDDLNVLLDDQETMPAQIFSGIHGPCVCAGCPPFHPEAPQEILDFGPVLPFVGTHLTVDYLWYAFTISCGGI